MKNVFMWFLLLIPVASMASVEKFKKIDEGGTGPYKAIAATESTLKGFVVYRPSQINVAAKKAGALPVMVFANGGCNDTSFPFERMLSEIASHGYLVIALGALQNRLDDRPLNKSPNEQMVQALDWISAQNAERASEYYASVDLTKVAFAGQSCGGAQVLAMAEESRITTYLMFNSGIGDMTMSGASRESLPAVHAPIVYLIGGKSDVAHANAELDYERINHVPVAFADAINAGHSGTFEAPNGGSFARMALKWLNWQLKNSAGDAQVFLQGDLKEFPDWTMKVKQFPGE